MTKWIGAALLTAALTFGAAATGPAIAASIDAAVQNPEPRMATHARRHVRHYTRYAYRPYDQPTYLDRPIYYVPAPSFPLAFGFGFGPWW